MMKRQLFLLVTVVVTIAVALLLIPGDDWTVALGFCLAFVLLGESAVTFAPELLAQRPRSILAWNVGMSVVPAVYFAVAAGLFALALGGLHWRILLSAHLVTLLMFGAAVVAIRIAGQRVVQTQQADGRTYDDVLILRARVEAVLDRLAALSLEEANTVEHEAREFLDRLRYAVPTVGADTAAGPHVLPDAVQRMECAVEAMQRGDEPQECLVEIRAQIKLADAALRRHRGTLTQMGS